jgi:hypothetical protein
MLCLSGSITLAGDFDGSKPLVCAPAVVMDCVVGTGCTKGTPEEMGAPAFLRIDFEKKVIIGPKRASPILFMDKSAEQLLLQGSELGFGWTLALDAEGKMITTMVDRTGAFVMYGRCMAL